MRENEELHSRVLQLEGDAPTGRPGFEESKLLTSGEHELLIKTLNSQNSEIEILKYR